MTVATDRTQEFTVDEIVLHAYRLAGLLNEAQALSVSKAANGRAAMQFALQRLEAEGMFARSTVFHYLTLESGTQSYAVDASVINVVGRAYYLPEGEDETQGEVEHSVAPIGAEEWASLTPKNASGMPTKYWLDRSTMTLWVDPIPDEAGKLRLQAQQLRATSLRGTVTPDVERWWSDYLRYQVAHDLALSNSRNLTVVAYLGQQAQDARLKAMAASRPQADNQFYVGR